MSLAVRRGKAGTQNGQEERDARPFFKMHLENLRDKFSPSQIAFNVKLVVNRQGALEDPIPNKSYNERLWRAQRLGRGRRLSSLLEDEGALVLRIKKKEGVVDEARDRICVRIMDASGGMMSKKEARALADELFHIYKESNKLDRHGETAFDKRLEELLGDGAGIFKARIIRDIEEMHEFIDYKEDAEMSLRGVRKDMRRAEARLADVDEKLRALRGQKEWDGTGDQQVLFPPKMGRAMGPG